MTFKDERTQQAWVALTQQKHAKLAKARVIAVEEAWRDLPPEEQARYLDLAYRAVTDTEKERTN